MNKHARSDSILVENLPPESPVPLRRPPGRRLHSGLIAASLSATLGLAAGPVHALKLVNKDSHSHDLTVKCSSTAHTSIGAHSTRDLGKGPCTVTVKKTGSSASGSGTLTIQGGKLRAS